MNGIEVMLGVGCDSIGIEVVFHVALGVEALGLVSLGGILGVIPQNKECPWEGDGMTLGGRDQHQTSLGDN